jgi:carbon monoxide dehydrogenase subunit G
MRASGEIVIERPVAAVWEWASDPRQWHRWQGGVREMRVEGELGVGSRFTSTQDYGDDTQEVEFEVVERRAPRLQVVRSLSAAFPFEGRLELTADVGGTLVRQTVDAGPADAVARLAFVVARPYVRRGMRRAIAAQLARLKAMVELEAVL